MVLVEPKNQKRAPGLWLLAIGLEQGKNLLLITTIILMKIQEPLHRENRDIGKSKE
jgi:hypothetical protein